MKNSRINESFLDRMSNKLVLMFCRIRFIVNPYNFLDSINDLFRIYQKKFSSTPHKYSSSWTQNDFSFEWLEYRNCKSYLDILNIAVFLLSELKVRWNLVEIWFNTLHSINWFTLTRLTWYENIWFNLLSKL